AVWAVAVSKPTTAVFPAFRLASDLEDEGADLFAFDEPRHPVLTGDVRGDLVDVERSLGGRLRFRADVFPGWELDADAVVDVRLDALEESALLGLLRAFVLRLRVLGDAAGNVVLVGHCASRRRHRTRQQCDSYQHRSQRPQSLHPASLQFAFNVRSMLPTLLFEHGYASADAAGNS